MIDHIWSCKLLNWPFDDSFHKFLNVKFRSLRIIEFTSCSRCQKVLFSLWRWDHINCLLERVNCNIIKVWINLAVFLVKSGISILACLLRLAYSVSVYIIIGDSVTYLRIELINRRLTWCCRINWNLPVLNSLLDILGQILKGRVKCLSVNWPRVITLLFMLQLLNVLQVVLLHVNPWGASDLLLRWISPQNSLWLVN